MKRLPLVLQMLVRVLGLVVLVLGIFLWSNGSAHVSLEHAHESLAILLVLVLWTLAVLGFRAKINPTFAGIAVLWGLAAVIFGLAQTHINPQPPAVAVRVVHLIIGLGVIGLGEGLGARIRKAS